MKRCVCAVLFCLLLIGCGRVEPVADNFSYTEHCVKYADQSVSVLDTQGQKKQPVRSADDAIEVAKKYCLINNVDISVSYDPLTAVYCVSFMTVYQMDGAPVYFTDDQIVHVYVNHEGIALMTVVIR